MERVWGKCCFVAILLLALGSAEAWAGFSTNNDDAYATEKEVQETREVFREWCKKALNKTQCNEVLSTDASGSLSMTEVSSKIQKVLEKTANTEQEAASLVTDFYNQFFSQGSEKVRRRVLGALSSKLGVTADESFSETRRFRSIRFNPDSRVGKFYSAKQVTEATNQGRKSFADQLGQVFGNNEGRAVVSKIDGRGQLTFNRLEDEKGNSPRSKLSEWLSTMQPPLDSKYREQLLADLAASNLQNSNLEKISSSIQVCDPPFKGGDSCLSADQKKGLLQSVYEGFGGDTEKNKCTKFDSGPCAFLVQKVLDDADAAVKKANEAKTQADKKALEASTTGGTVAGGSVNGALKGDSSKSLSRETVTEYLGKYYDCRVPKEGNDAREFLVPVQSGNSKSCSVPDSTPSPLASNATKREKADYEAKLKAPSCAPVICDTQVECIRKKTKELDDLNAPREVDNFSERVFFRAVCGSNSYTGKACGAADWDHATLVRCFQSAAQTRKASAKEDKNDYSEPSNRGRFESGGGI